MKFGMVVAGLLFAGAAFGESLEKDGRAVLSEVGDFERVYSDFQTQFLPIYYTLYF